jgi:hypothetical protein
VILQVFACLAAKPPLGAAARRRIKNRRELLRSLWRVGARKNPVDIELLMVELDCFLTTTIAITTTTATTIGKTALPAGRSSMF